MAVLITCGADAAAYQVAKILSADTIWFADHYPMPQLVSSQRKFIQLADGSSPAFAHTLLTVCLDNQITEVYPLRKPELAPLAEAKLLFYEYGITVFVPELDMLNSLPYSGAGNSLCVVDKGKVVAGIKPLWHKEKISGIFTSNEGELTPSVFAIL